MFSSFLNVLPILLLSSSVFADNHLRPKHFGQPTHFTSPRTLRVKRQGGLGGALAQALQNVGDNIGDLGDNIGLGPVVDPLVGTPVVNDPATQTSTSATSAGSATVSITGGTSITGGASNVPSGTVSTPSTDPSTDHTAPDPTTTSTVPLSTSRGGGLIPTLTSILNPPKTPEPAPTSTSTSSSGANSTDTANGTGSTADSNPTSTSTGDGGILGPILGGPTSSSGNGGILGPILGGPTDTPAPTSIPTDTANGTSSTADSNPTSTSTGDGGILGPILGGPSSSSGDGGILGPILGGPTNTDTPASTPTDTATGSSSTADSNPTSTSSSGDGGILGPILGPTSSDGGILGPIIGTPTDTDTSATATSTSSSGDGGILGPIIGTPTDTDTSATATSTSSSGDGGILGPIIGPIIGTPTDTDTSGSTATATNSTANGPTETTVPKPTDTPPTSTTSDGGILPTIISIPPILSSILPTGPNDTSTSTTDSSTSGTDGGSTDTSEPPSSSTPSSSNTDVPPASSTITASPSGSTVDSSSVSASVTLTSSSIGSGIGEPTDVFPNTTVSTVSPSITESTVPTRSDDGAFSYATASSLLVDSTSSTSTVITQTDPDAVPSTTLTLPPSINPTAAPVQSPLPSNMPSKIFSTTSVVDPSSPQLNGHSLISILFTLDLNWAFVTSNNQTMGQLFRYMPSLIAGSLNMDANNLYTYALQVSIPTGWKGDTSQLGSTYMVYIPSDQIDTLGSLMRTATSSFHSQPGIPGQLAMRVIPNSLVEVPQSSVNNGFASDGASNQSSSSSSKKRTDAIIGICVAVGGVAALIGIWWLVKYWQRRQAAKHKRLSNLSDPNRSNGIYGTQHDERRTSFFYAEDELRGGYNEPSDENVMTQRVRAQAAGHGPISAPVLQQNSLNW